PRDRAAGLAVRDRQPHEGRRGERASEPEHHDGLGGDPGAGLPGAPPDLAARGRTVLVIKVGGAEGVDYDAVCADLAALAREGRPWVLVHGGSHETNVVAEKLGHPPRFLTSEGGFTSRKTDRTTLEIFEMVYCGK